MDGNKTVGIFTTFSEWSPQYSLTSVVHDQLVMHVKHGYRTVLFVLPQFRDDEMVPDGVEIRKVIPQIILEPYKGLAFPEHIDDDTKKVADALNEHAQDIDIIITHDWVFIDTYLPYNIGMRQSNLKAKRYHWIHSAPSQRPALTDNPHANRYTMPPNSKLVYLNNDKALALAEMYGAWLKDVRVIPNSIDPRTFWGMTKTAKDLIDKYNILPADIISVYPVSTPRMIDGKQVDVVIKIHAELKKLGYTTRLIVPNAHCNAEEDKDKVEAMLDLAEEWGLTKHEVIFTSLEGFEMGIPRNVISDLFRLSNIFIFPSISENCSLIMLEAMISGNLMVLNKDCTGLSEFGGPNALYFRMGNLDMGTRTTEHALEKREYVGDVAKIIASEFEQNRALQSKRAAFKKFNIDNIFAQIERMYYES